MPNRATHYILQDQEVIPATFDEFCQWLRGNPQKQLARTLVNDDICVSTVFLGIDHNFSDEGPPIVFETMVFGGEYDQEQWRYATYEEAIEGHNTVLREVRGLLRLK